MYQAPYIICSEHSSVLMICKCLWKVFCLKTRIKTSFVYQAYLANLSLPSVHGYSSQLHCALILVMLLNSVSDVDLQVLYQPGTFLVPAASPASPPLPQLGFLLVGTCTCSWEFLSGVFRYVCLVCETHLCCCDPCLILNNPLVNSEFSYAVHRTDCFCLGVLLAVLLLVLLSLCFIT